MDFTIEQVDAAIEFVIRHGAEDRGERVSYSRAFEAASLPAPQEVHGGGDPAAVTRFMKAFHDRCVENGMPPLDALVVHVGPPREGTPGGGYFKVNGWADPYGSVGTNARKEEALVRWAAEMDECTSWGIEHRKARRRTGAS